MTDRNQQQEEEARSLLDRLGAERKELEARLDEIQKETYDAIVSVLMARTLGPSDVARRVQYDRQHVARIAKKAGVPPLREATVVSRAKATAKSPRPAAASPRQRVTQAVSEPLAVSTRVAALPADRVKELAEAAEGRHPEWVEGIRHAHPNADEYRMRYLIVEAGLREGFRPPELAEQSEPEKETTA